MTDTDVQVRTKPQIRWTPEYRRRLTEGWLRGDSVEQIAAELGVSKQSIFSRAHCLGLPSRERPEWPQAAIEHVKTRWLEGWSAGQISSETGRTRNSILGKLKRLGLLRNSAGPRVTNYSLRKVRDPKPPKPPKLPEPVLEWAGSRNVALLDLEDGECRFSYSANPPYLFCGQPTLKGLSWCPRCHSLVFNNPVSTRRTI